MLIWAQKHGLREKDIVEEELWGDNLTKCVGSALLPLPPLYAIKPVLGVCPVCTIVREYSCHWQRAAINSPPKRPWASLYSPGDFKHSNFWVPWPSKYTVQVVCKWAVAVCVCGAGSNEMQYKHCMEFQTAMTLSLSNSLIMTRKAISIYCFIVWTV